ncbi:MAG: Fe-S cluster assembly protein SufB [Candidatus Calescibacterium sp.]|nr:Fe-S cluster assembly protein SufB [Candidatus Calescibacterium sp.]MCX7972506.1 Fe-S cluster assembly protein SufB [bacterium]
MAETYKYDFKDPYLYKEIFDKGLDEDKVIKISKIKGEPEWMTEFRVRAYRIFISKPMPKWGNTELLNKINFDDIHYYVRPQEDHKRSWDEVPEYIKKTFERLGIPEAERKFLAGVTAQYESEVVYHSIRQDLAKQGVIFTDMDTGLREYPEIVRKYFGTVVPPEDNKFAALNSAVWSGGSFVYVPPNVKVSIPLQAYFRINARNMGQFERTLIIADEGSEVTYIEGCTAPIYSSQSLHAAVVEIIALPNSKVQYITIQNWSKDVYNLVTKRSVAYTNAKVGWIDANIGSLLTMKYPSIYLLGEGARGEIISVAFAKTGQHQDAGSKIVMAAPNTSATVTSKSISVGSGRASYRGLVKVYKEAKNAKVNVQCDALLLDPESRTDTYPVIEVHQPNAVVTHEATVSKISEQQLYYLMSRGLSPEEAKTLIIHGFIENFIKELPMEYALEMNRLIALEMEGSVG